MKNKLVYAVTVIAAVLYLIVGHQAAVRDLTLFKEKAPTDVVQARVTAVLTPPAGTKFEQNYFQAELSSGRHEGLKVKAVQNKTGVFAAGRDVKPGDKVLLLPGQGPDAPWSYAEHLRSDVLLWLLVLFAVGIIALGRLQGFNTLLSLIFCCLSIFAVFVPAILSGKNVYLWTVLTCASIIISNLLLVNGISKKTIATILGCAGGLLIAALLTFAADVFLKLTGLVDEDSMYLLLVNKDNPVDLKAIVFSAISIGALGAIMDVAMDIASALNELAASAENPTRRMLIRAGNNIGRDILGMMSNTLILAYIGGSLTIVLLFAAYGHSLLYLLNREMVVVEVLQAVIGSFGILVTIPLTSFICSRLYVKNTPRRRRRAGSHQAAGDTESYKKYQGPDLSGSER